MTTPTTQFRFDPNLKSAFKKVSTLQDKTMTEIVIKLVSGYIIEAMQDPSVMRSLRDLDTAEQTGLVKDSRGTWVQPTTITREDDWRHHLNT